MSLSKCANLSPKIRLNSFNFEDDVTYADFEEEEFPGYIVFPHTLNIYLRRKIQEITSENGCILRALQDAEEKLKLLEKSTVSKTSLSSEAKNKTITSTESVHLNDNKKQNNGKDNKHLKKQLIEKNVQINLLNEKLKLANDEILEVKNSNMSLKQEINKTQKVSSIKQYSKRNWSAAENLRNLEKERRQQAENSVKELKQAEIDLENISRKLEASKARIKVLENELGVSKKNVILLNEKKCHDDHLIESLKVKLKAMEIRFLDREVEIQNQKEKLERQNDVMKNELESVQVQNNQLHRKLVEREKEIHLLKKFNN